MQGTTRGSPRVTQRGGGPGGTKFGEWKGRGKLGGQPMQGPLGGFPLTLPPIYGEDVSFVTTTLPLYKVRVLLLASSTVFNDESLAAQFGNFTVCVLCYRLASSLWHTHGLPGVFAGMLNPDRRLKLVEWLKKTYDSWLIIDKRKAIRWSKLRERSPFQLILVKKV